MQRAVRALLIAAVFGCSSTNTVAPSTAQLVISLPATVISATRGNRIAVPVEVTRENGPASTVTITVSAPTGVTASVASQSANGSTTTAEIAVTVNGAAATGRYVVVISAHATGYPDASSSLALDVNQ
jgi:hypothetical protein